MNLEEIEQRAIEIYNRNLEFIKKQNKELFENIKLFEEGLSKGLIKERYTLEYKDRYFDVFDNKTNSWIYNQDSKQYSSKIVERLNNDTLKNSFKTFYEFKYEKGIAENVKNASILSDTYLTISPIVSYVQDNLDEKQELTNFYKFFIFGVGLGIHIPYIHSKVNAKVYLIIEPSLELFRLSLFVTDYSLINATLHFAIAMEEFEFKKLVYKLSEQTFMYDYYIKFFLFSNNCDIYINTIQNFLVSQSHILYAFNRQLESLERTYNYMYEGFKYINISNRNNFFDKPIIILAMGPSLEKNIEFIKENQNKFIVISIYAALPILEKNNIVPDIVTQYDQQDEVVMSTLKKVKDISFFADTLFLFASHIDPKLIRSFNKENIYLFHAFFESRKGFSSITSPSIGELTYGLILSLGAKRVYLLGLDLALADDRTSHSGEHEGANAYSNIKEKSNQEFSFKKNILKVKGNFRNVVETLPVFKSSISQMNTFSRYYKSSDIQVFNLSDGALLEGTIPLTIDNFHIKELSICNKKEEIKKIRENLDSISTDEIRKEDIIFNEQKYIDAKFLFKVLDEFHTKRKYSSIQEYKNAVFILFNELIYIDKECKDLQKILVNFYKYTLPPIFYFLNIKKISNPKRHIKQLNKFLYMQTKKIFDEYFKILSDNKKK